MEVGGIEVRDLGGEAWKRDWDSCLQKTPFHEVIQWLETLQDLVHH